MSTASDEIRISRFNGNCFRCGKYGHPADSPECPWQHSAASLKEHHARIDSFARRWQEHEITRSQKREFITAENEIWKARAA